MQLSKKKVNKNLGKQMAGLLYQVVADLGNPEEVQSFLEDFLSKTELRILVKRLAVAQCLNQGQSYREIKKNLAVSSATISTIGSQMKRKDGFSLALKKIKTEEWADRWANRIIRTFKIKKEKKP